MPDELTNPDLVALDALRETLRDLTVPWPDGGSATFDHIDVGYMSKPVAYPYVSLHTIGSRAPVRHLGRGAGKEARGFEVDAIVEIEYEDPDPKRGFARLTQLRWDVFLHLIQQRHNLGGSVEFTNLDDATITTYNVDEGNYEDWGFYGQILIPLTIHLRGAKV